MLWASIELDIKNACATLSPRVSDQLEVHSRNPTLASCVSTYLSLLGLDFTKQVCSKEVPRLHITLAREVILLHGM